MKRLLFIVLALFIWGCAPPSTIKYYPNGAPQEATNYTVTGPGTAQVPFIADNWFTGAMKSILDGLGPYLNAFSSYFGGKTVVPTPTPTPAPTPTPTPTPVRPYP